MSYTEWRHPAEWTLTDKVMARIDADMESHRLRWYTDELIEELEDEELERGVETVAGYTVDYLRENGIDADLVEAENESRCPFCGVRLVDEGTHKHYRTPDVFCDGYRDQGQDEVVA